MQRRVSSPFLKGRSIKVEPGKILNKREEPCYKTGQKDDVQRRISFPLLKGRSIKVKPERILHKRKSLNTKPGKSTMCNETFPNNNTEEE